MSRVLNPREMAAVVAEDIVFECASESQLKIYQSYLEKAEKEMKNSGLSVRVLDGELIISIGVNTLAWAAAEENGGPIKAISPGKEGLFAHSVAMEMRKEDEGFEGQSKIGKWLDSICRDVHEYENFD